MRERSCSLMMKRTGAELHGLIHGLGKRRAIASSIGELLVYSRIGTCRCARGTGGVNWPFLYALLHPIARKRWVVITFLPGRTL
jgi:hypothetical protein